MWNKLKSWTAFHSVLVLAIPTVLIAVLWRADGENLTALWSGAIFSLLLMIWLAGFGITGRFAGLLIDKRNKMSLSRFQAATWTILVLATLVTCVFFNLDVVGVDKAANITIPGEILGLIGISAAALVGSPILLSARDQKTVVDQPSRMKTAAARSLVNAAKTNTANAPLVPIHKNDSISQASVADMFKGDEIDNFQYLDLAKVQNFLFNLIVIALYGGVIYTMLGAAAGIEADIKQAKAALDAASAVVQSAQENLTELKQAAQTALAKLNSISQSGEAAAIDARAVLEQANTAVSEATGAVQEGQASEAKLQAELETAEKVERGISTFPEISGGMLALLGISTGGYLANKGVAHTPTDDA